MAGQNFPFWLVRRGGLCYLHEARLDVLFAVDRTDRGYFDGVCGAQDPV
jgi:hypothetical protein